MVNYDVRWDEVAQCKKGWSGVLCSEKQVLANTAAVLLVKLLHPWNAPTATAEKCQKSNREIWKSVRALSQEIHLETCNEENLKWRSKEIFFSKSLFAFSVIHHCTEFGTKAGPRLCQRIQIPISCKKLRKRSISCKNRSISCKRVEKRSISCKKLGSQINKLEVARSVVKVLQRPGAAL